jgi:ribosome-binding protein aMBF1 (putative translation factor)
MENVKRQTAQRAARFVLSARKKLGISQTELANKLGIKTYITILNYEKGKTTPPLWVMTELERLLKSNNITTIGETHHGKLNRDGHPVSGTQKAGRTERKRADV